MQKFTEKFKEIGNISFKGMKDAAKALLPKDKVSRDKLYEELTRGTNILSDEDHLNMYLYSFGNMHEAKLNKAFSSLPQNITNIFNNEVEILDWGCGQGTASICLLDFLKRNNIKPNFKYINLIEPSEIAIERAVEIIKIFNTTFNVIRIIKNFDDLTPENFHKSETTKIHLFSNILDVSSFNLSKFINLFQKAFKGKNFFICVGPFYTNSRRVDDFIAATAPDEEYVAMNKNRGEWDDNKWTISLHIFFKNFKNIEPIEEIRKRIDKSHKKEQFFAGYILDAVSEEYQNTPIAKETESLYNFLSVFDVQSTHTISSPTEYDPKLAVIANIISRGLPTKAPILIEKIFSEAFQISTKPQKECPIINFASKHQISAQGIYEALHIIDPRFDIDFYNGDMLESRFEKYFVEKLLKGSKNEYLIQLLEPQRRLSSITDIKETGFNKDQRIDFTLEFPLKDSGAGIIFEIDGTPYHSDIFQRIYDMRRDEFEYSNGFKTNRINNSNKDSFLDTWERNGEINKYLTIIRKNKEKTLTGQWNKAIQIVLSPLAIARVERILLEAIQQGVLDTQKEQWDIAIVERDVPCGVIAIDDLRQNFEKLNALIGDNIKMPKVNLCIVSTNEFKESPLHLGNKIDTKLPTGMYFDVCIDISMLLRDKIDALPLNVMPQTEVYVIRSAHYKKKNRVICTSENIQYPELVKKDDKGNYRIIQEREELLTYFLRNIFRKSFFRPGQLPILSHILSDKTTIGLLPTGGGKSLTYQLSCILQPGTSIIIDPLISLMSDQIRGLRGIRIDSCECVNSSMDHIEKEKKLNILRNGSVMFMLLSPERFMMKNFRENLVTMAERNHVYFSYGIIDEVHCVSEWGHDFRTSYLHLGRNMINFMQTKSNRPLSIIGLTATASFDVLADVERELTSGGKLNIDSEAIIRPENNTREELTYRIIEVKANFDELKDPNEPYIIKSRNEWDLKEIVAKAKKRRLLQLLEEIPVDIEKQNDNKKSTCYIDNFSVKEFYNSTIEHKYNNGGIIFCPHAKGIFGVNDTDGKNPRHGLSTFLVTEKQNLSIGTFVGGDSPDGDMLSFNNNNINLMVATKAFGMGIDKSNIRFTINLNYPSSIESYVQEAGRAGRDKKHAISYILYEPTEYIHLTVDKIDDIRWYMGKEYPTWLEKYKNTFVLSQDLLELCNKNDSSQSQANNILNIIHNCGFFENVDKDIDLWFHNNSFRGLDKEKWILSELTRKIKNVKATNLTEIQGKLQNIIGNSNLHLYTDKKNNAIKIISEEKKRYGYLYLENLHPVYTFIDFDYNVCKHIVTSLIKIIKNDYPEHSVENLLKPISSENDTTDGIYNVIERAGKDGYGYVTVSWENLYKQESDRFYKDIKDEIKEIANKKGWNNIDEDRYEKLCLENIGTFDDLIEKIARCSNDERWILSHADENAYKDLKRIFYRKRDKDDTDKAIYRMCCIGLVEDVTVDYNSQTYELKVLNRTDQELKNCMVSFFRKYYSSEQAEKKVEEIENQKGEKYSDKCLGYLTKFVYENLKKKRLRAIEDMRIACEDSITNRKRTGNDDWIKDFIHLYFNSKYARIGYSVNNKNYSLTEDIDNLNKDDFDIVKKYIEIMNKDESGSEVDNVKHLYGATLLCLRAHPDNAALQLLSTYCITFLGTSTNETLKSYAFNGYVDGFMTLYNKNHSEVWKYISYFNKCIEEKVHDDYIQEHIIEKGKEYIMLFIHGKELEIIKNKFINR